MIDESIPTPSKIGLLRELAALRHLPGGLLTRPRPRNDACRQILILPGIGTGDRATRLLRRYLELRGHSVHGWGLGRNHGQVGKLLPAVLERLKSLYLGDDGTPLVVVGWSLGGVIAREAARERPQWLERIVTLGTPVVGGPRHTVFGHQHSEQELQAMEARIAEREATALSVPITAVYSKRDAVVAWQSCIDHHSPRVDHLEVAASHLGMMLSVEVFEAVTRAVETPDRHGNGPRTAPSDP